MKRLISARDVEEAARTGSCLHVDATTIVTPQARDLARERGVSLKCEECKEASCASTSPASASSPASEPALSAEEIEQVIRAALASGVWTEQKLKELMKVQGRM